MHMKKQKLTLRAVRLDISHYLTCQPNYKVHTFLGSVDPHFVVVQCIHLQQMDVCILRRAHFI